MTKGELKKLLNESSDDDSAEVYIASGATSLTENYYYILDAKKIVSLTDPNDIAVYLYFDTEEGKNEI